MYPVKLIMNRTGANGTFLSNQENKLLCQEINRKMPITRNVYCLGNIRPCYNHQITIIYQDKQHDLL